MSLKDFNLAKRAVWNLWQSVNAAGAEQALEMLHDSMNEHVLWRGPAPLNDIRGREAVMERVWVPLFRAIPDLTRRYGVFMGGRYEERTWVSSTGYLTGSFVEDWLGIPATGNRMHIRFGEFCAVLDDGIEEVILGLDIVDVMRQAGYSVLSGNGGKAGLVPPPTRGDSLMLEDQDILESQKSLRLLQKLTSRLNDYDKVDVTSVRSDLYKDVNYLWYGPGGIGSTRNLQEFERCHQKPFLAAFPDRRFGRYDVALGEGSYASCAGWPSMSATHLGGYLGTDATDRPVTLKFMDWFTRQGDAFVENRVWFDLIDLMLQCDVDLMARMKDMVDAA